MTNNNAWLCKDACGIR